VRIAGLWRYPVKTMLGERIAAAEVGRAGLEGDRRWAVCDAATGEVLRKGKVAGQPELWACRAHLAAGALQVTLPDGAVVTGDAIAPALSELVGSPVVLRENEAGGSGQVFDSGAHHTAPVHLVSTGTLALLHADERRLRPNVVVEAAEAFAEQRLLGGRLRGRDGLELSIVVPTPRCVVPTRAREELPAEPGLLKAIARANSVDLGPFGEQPCAGVYAEVAQGGPIAEGDVLHGAPATIGERTALDVALARLSAATPPARTGR
jgi:uncharacterized protein YcbX